MSSMWRTIAYDEEKAKRLQRELGFTLLTSRLLVQREIYNKSDAEEFLYADLDSLSDPFKLKGMNEALDRINQAIINSQKIFIYGDYDVDGICSVVILYELLQLCGADVEFYIPDRFAEGYGLNPAAIEEIEARGCKLLITVDCGISSAAEALLCKNLGIDLIITDHHTPGINQPEAYTIINPKNDNIRETRDLAGAGVSLKIAMALGLKYRQVSYEKWLDLAALATVADMVPLRFENRILVRAGLNAIHLTERPGLQALMRLTKLEGKKIDSWSLGFLLAPKLNSAGRLENANLAVKLLLTKNEAEGRELAELLCSLNQQRKAIEDNIMEQAARQVDRQLEKGRPLVLVISGENWNSGVIGIVASRIAKIYSLPTIVISWENDVGRGSGRSVGEFDIFAALNYCSTFLIKFGGHKLAAGLSIEKNNLLNFQKTINEYAKVNESDIMLSRDEYADLEIAPQEIEAEILDELELLEPYGIGNPEPRFIIRGAQICEASKVGKKGEHLKFKTVRGGFDSIAFRQGSVVDHRLWNYANIDMIFSLNKNTFRGESNLQLHIFNIQPAYYDISQPEDGFLSKMNRVVTELQEKRLVLFLYSDYRSLMKHFVLVKHYFTSENIYILHGRLRKSVRNLVEERIAREKPGIILATASCWQTYLRRFQVPVNLSYTLYCWPESGEQYAIMPQQNIQTDILPQKDGDNFSNSAYSMDEKGLIYINNRKNLNVWEKRTIHYKELDYTDMNLRRIIRSRFLGSNIPKLFTDGAHVNCVDYDQKIKSIILADLPFCYADLEGLRLGINGNITYSIAFNEAQIAEGQKLLCRIYPEYNLIIAIWNFLIRQKNKELRGEIDNVLKQIVLFIKKPLKRLDLISVLHILEDLGLCQFVKSGSIIAIKLTKQSKKVIHLKDSPYYLEGLASKKAYHNMILYFRKKII